MALTVQCPGCGSHLQAGDELAGKKVRCQKCRTVIEIPADALPADALPAEAPAAPPEAAITPDLFAPSPRRRRPVDEDEDEDEDDERSRRRPPAKKASSRGIIGVLLGIVGVILLGSCCIGIGLVGWFAAARVPAPVQVQVKAIAPPPEMRVQVNKDFDGPMKKLEGIPLAKDGPPKPNPPEPPTPIQLDDKGVAEMRGVLDPQQKDPQLQFRPVKRFRLEAKAETAYVVEVPMPPNVEVRVEPAGGGPAIEPKGPFGAPRNQLAFFADKVQTYQVLVIGNPANGHGPFTLRIRAWDESTPLPDTLRFPAPPTAVPGVAIALQVPNKLFTGGAFAPNNQRFWTADQESVLTLWEHPKVEKRGSYRMNKKTWLHALAVDAKGRLYAQSMPSNPASIAIAKPAIGPIEVYAGLDPKGDANDLPEPKRIELGGIVHRMIAAPDGRWVYFLDTHNRKLGRIDPETGTIDRTLDKISTSTRAFCLSADGKKIYACSDTNRIDVIAAPELQLERSVTLDKGQPFEIAATDKGLVFLLGVQNKDFPFTSSNCWMADLSRPGADKAVLMSVSCGHRGQFLQMAPDQKTVFISGDRKVSACVVPAHPALFQAAVRDYPTRDFFTPGWIQISPDGRTMLNDLGMILSVSR